jgi:hypothetical protein
MCNDAVTSELIIMGGHGIREKFAFVQKSDRVELDNLMLTTVRDFVNKLFPDTQNGV